MARGTLALDLATMTGWAYGEPQGRPVHGSARLHGMGSLGANNCALIDALADLVAIHDPASIIMEAPAMHMAGRSPHTARMLIYLAGSVETFCYRRSIPLTEAQVMTVRKHLGIKKLPGDKDSKPGVMRWCRAQGYQPLDDNQGDALALLAYGHAVAPLRAAA